MGSEMCIRDSRHVAGSANVVADTLSRPPSLTSVAAVTESVTSSADIALAQSQVPEEMEKYITDERSTLSFEWCDLPGNLKLLCDVSLAPAPPRPVVPLSLVKDVLSSCHSLSHAGGNALLRDVRRRYVWFRMASDVKEFARGCLPCQRAKITRHSRAPLAPLDMPDHRFSALHVDIVGPLPESEGFTYLLTIIDRFSRWLEAVPLSDISAIPVRQRSYGTGCPVLGPLNPLSRTGADSSLVTCGVNCPPPWASPVG